MSTAATLLKANAAHTEETPRSWLTPLRLHWLGVALLLGINTFLLVRLGMLWHDAGAHSADAIAQQRLDRKASDAAAEPLRGVDAKVAKSTAEADRFYRDRLSVAQSQFVAELGDLAKRNNVRMTRAAYTPAIVLAGTSAQLTEWKIDAGFSGDYRQLVQFINALERDRTFFVIDGVTLNGQQTGLVNLRLRLTTYLRDDVNTAAVDQPAAASHTAPAGGAR